MSKAKRYTKRNVSVEAVRYDGENAQEINRYFMDGQMRWHPIHDCPVVGSGRGDYLVAKGDYIVKGATGEWTSYKPMEFHATYTNEDGSEIEEANRG